MPGRGEMSREESEEESDSEEWRELFRDRDLENREQRERQEKLLKLHLHKLI